MPILIIAAVAATAATATAIGTSIAKNKAANKAVDARKKALAKQKDIQVTGEGGALEHGKEQDIQHYTDSYAEFAKQNPELAAARTTAAKNLNQSLIEGPGRATALLDQATTEAMAKAPEVSLADQIVNTAKQNLDRGATLSPDFQGELIRAGLEQSGQAGIGADRAGAVTQRLGTLLGSAGEQLRSKRMAEAGGAVDLAGKLRAQRQNILQGLVSTSQAVRLGEMGTQASVIQGVDAMVPSIGMSGSDRVKMELINLSNQNQRAWQAGQISAQAAQNQADLIAGILGGINSGVQTFASTYSGSPMPLDPDGGKVTSGPAVSGPAWGSVQQPWSPPYAAAPTPSFASSPVPGNYMATLGGSYNAAGSLSGNSGYTPRF